MQPFDRLQELFMKLPGIGRRQARRLVFFLLQQDSRFRLDLANLIQAVDNNMQQCSNSFQYFYSENLNERFSPIERSPSRDRSQLMIVEKDMDLEAIEKSKIYNGVYFVLGGLLPVIKDDSSHLRTNQLLEQVELRSQKKELKEIIMAFSYNPESEHTRRFLEEKLKAIVREYDLKISKLGRGLSTGSELEYSDADTLRSALESRS